MTPEEMAAASRLFFGGYKHLCGQSPCVLTPEFVREIEVYREAVRAEEGGGGMCHVVTEWLQDRFGWERLSVTYMTDAGEIICGGGHVVNILPDGSLLDPTRDQFGEGHSVSFISADSLEIGRYRPEFYEDYYPGHPDVEPGELDAWMSVYSGVSDYLVTDLRQTRGEGWWLEDKTHYNAYLECQKKYAEQNPLTMRF